MNLAKIDTIDPHRPVRVTHGGETRWASRDDWREVADELVAAHGAGVPEVVDTAASPDPKSPAPVSQPAPRDVKAGERDIIGEMRSTGDLEAARGAGFAPKPTVYARGLRVNGTGVENATLSRVEHDARPNVAPAMEAFEARIRAEERRDHVTQAFGVRMRRDGAVTVPGVGHAVTLTEPAFQSLLGYHTGIGGSAYLAKCWPRLRAANINNWMVELGGRELAERNALTGKALEEWKPREVKLRLRKSAGGGEEVFGCVGASYTSFDVDRVARGLALAMPDKAKAQIAYDGHRAVFDVTFHSNVAPKHYVAGEFFKAGIRIRTDDHGGSSIVGSAIVYQNLCLNLIIIDECAQPLFRIRHTGSVEELARKFRAGMERGLSKLEHFLKAWDYACEKPLLDDIAVDPGALAPKTIEEAFPGLFNGIIERELVPVRGQREAVVHGLASMVEKDKSYAMQRGGSRAAVVNAFTRYAHEVADPFVGDEIERSVSSLIYGRGGRAPAPLPYLAPKR